MGSTGSVSGYCFMLVLLLSSFSLCSFAAQDGKKQQPSLVVVGSVYSDTKPAHSLSGALVAVECNGTGLNRPLFRQRAITDRHGNFRIHLPAQRTNPHNLLTSIKSCSLHLLKPSTTTSTTTTPLCTTTTTTTTTPATRITTRNGINTISIGRFGLQPSKLCDTKSPMFFPSPPMFGFLWPPSPLPTSPLMPSPPPSSLLPPSRPMMPFPRPRAPAFPFLPPPPSPLPPSRPMTPLPRPRSWFPPAPAFPFLPPPPSPLMPPFRFPTIPFFPPGSFFPGVPPAFPAEKDGGAGGSP